MKRKRDGRAVVTVSPATANMLATNNVDLTDWDDEELLRGRRRNKNGEWTAPS